MLRKNSKPSQSVEERTSAEGSVKVMSRYLEVVVLEAERHEMT